RRVVQPELVIALAKYMVAGGWVFLQSDVESIALEMTERFQAHPHFVRQHQTPWLEENIFPVPTEREKSTYNKGQPVYRSLFRVR
ncbi:MAG: tRNA (guanosine(46)-N7)-methyltransferase TrmB, partial [Microcystis sp. M53600_WE12]|nr:tRNA (guanosine(46)-N7)-methyltransferase TrmB [Microcystis sp. M53600_WE12]